MHCGQLYDQRLARYLTAMRNEQPDRVPVRPFVAEFTGVYAGYTCQELAHEYEKAFAAARRCAADFAWDAVVPNMLATWTGMTQAMGLDYYLAPGTELPPNVGHQYREPPPEAAYMWADEYDALIEDPTGFLYNVWLPRVARPLAAPGEQVTWEHNLSLVKGALAMSRFFQSWGDQERRLREECDMPAAISGMLRAPLDLLADKLRGYLGLVEDLLERPQKVLAACEALMPHLAWFAQQTADPAGLVPVGFWMHRGCVPFISFDHFDRIFWPTTRPIIEELWAAGHQTLCYAEGNWRHHLHRFAELPERSVVYHVDQGDILEVHQALGDRFCLSGGLPNRLLSLSSPEDVRRHCRHLIETVGRDGGYILDASAIIGNDAKVENIRAMTQAAADYGVYSRGHSAPVAPAAVSAPPPVASVSPRKPPGACIPWSDARSAYVPVRGDEQICQRVWNSIDTMAAMYVWWIALAF